MSLVPPKKSYSLLIISRIPVYGDRNNGYHTLDLWQRDLYYQQGVIEKCTLVCPVKPFETKPQGVKKIPKEITVLSSDQNQSKEKVSDLLKFYDVLQVTGGGVYKDLKSEFLFLKRAKILGKPVVVGISSDRGQTVIMNAEKKNFLSRLKAFWIAQNIKKTQKFLTKEGGGVFLCGEGLKKLVCSTQKNIYIDTPSWVSEEDFLSEKKVEEKIHSIRTRKKLNLCVACRLEFMKGVHIAIEALSKLLKEDKNFEAELAILGKGEQLSHLQEMVKNKKLQEYVSFEGSYAYPGEFFNKIKNYDLMLVTNLNKEQPRILFDAISQGVIPICPHSVPYTTLPLDPSLYYEKGSPESLAQTILTIKEQPLGDVMKSLVSYAKKNTIESMHKKRSEWIQKLFQCN